MTPLPDSGSGSGDNDREVEASLPGLYYLPSLPLFSLAFSSLSVWVCLTYPLLLSEALAEGGVAQADASSCEICQFGAECDIDDEDVW